ncbi:unnamed protein product [Lampetra fluviatilis]
MGRLSQRRSFGELSLLLCHVSPCTLVTRTLVRLAVLEPGAMHCLDPITKALILQTAKPTFGDLTQAVPRAVQHAHNVPSFLFMCSAQVAKLMNNIG